jgi:hypothetical protein
VKIRFLARFRFCPRIGWNLGSRFMMSLTLLVAGRGILRTRPAFSPRLATMRLVALGLPRWLDAAQGPAQVIQFAFIRQFLALGHLNQFQNLVNAIHQNL